VVTLEGLTVGAAPLAVQPGATVVVRSPKVRLKGTVKAAEGRKLSRAVLAPVKGGKERALPGGDKEPDRLDVDEELSLEPGVTECRVAAQSAGSPEATALLRVEYHPALPAMRLASPAPDAVLRDDEGKPEVEVVAELTPAEDAREYQAEVVVNGEAKAVKV